MTSSKVKEIKSVREYKSDRCSTWYFTVEMDNGDKGQIARRTDNGANVGDLLTYTVDNSGQYTKLVEEKKGGFSGRPPVAKHSTAVIALTLAKDILVENIAITGKPLPMDAALAKRMTDFAGELNAWLIANDK